jgi:lipopolysaccharide transport system ATP-binding protein
LSTFDGNGNADDIIWALRDVSFEVKHGEVFGIIGRNGSGKSTLLKIISRITKPASGRATLKGRVASLLEVGTGFHAELTGRENIYLNATILGMSKREVDRKFDEIVAFSGVEKFIDTPFKRYSSGMKVRLGFSVAAHLEAEILLVDEVLAVGDHIFQQKCIGRMQEVASEGRTVLFVSHDMAAVERLCQKCMMLEQGRMTRLGPTSEIIASYIGHDADGKLEWRRSEPPPDHAYIRRVTMIDYEGQPVQTVTTASKVGIEIECIAPDNNPNLKLGFAVCDSYENPIFFSAPMDFQVPPPANAGIYQYRVFLPEVFFMPQRYTINVAIYVNRVWSDTIFRALILDVQDVASLANSDGKKRQGIIQIHCRWERSFSR